LGITLSRVVASTRGRRFAIIVISADVPDMDRVYSLGRIDCNRKRRATCILLVTAMLILLAAPLDFDHTRRGLIEPASLASQRQRANAPKPSQRKDGHQPTSPKLELL